MSHGDLLASPTWTKPPFQWPLQPLNFHLPSCTYASYSCTLPLKSSCHERGGEICLRSSHSSRRPCGRTKVRTIICPPLYCCQSLPPPFTPIEMQVHRLRRLLASMWHWGSCKQLPRPRLRWSGSCSSNRKGWVGITRTTEPGWLSRWTPHSGRSSPKWVKPIQWGFFLGFSLHLPILAQVPYVLWVKHLLLLCNQGQMPQQTTPLQDLKAL